jgi:glycosyltransferase involved in cell wall biosynthesis
MRDVGGELLGEPLAGRAPAGTSIAAVIPARDSAAFISGAIESVFAQSRLPDEVIVVDDGSTDGTAAVVERSPIPVRLLRIPAQGVAAARNAGVQAARAEFIAFLDADDYWHRDHLKRMADAIRATEGRAGLYFSDIEVAEERGGRTLWEQCRFRIDEEYDLRLDGKEWLFMRWQPILLQASVVSRSEYLAVGGSDDRLTRRSDTHVVFKLGLGSPMCAVAGLAGEWTARNKDSLTQIYQPDHRVYADCTVVLYDDLSTWPGLDGRSRRELRKRSAGARVWLAKEAGLRHPIAASNHLTRAALESPSTPVVRGLRKLVGAASPVTHADPTLRPRRSRFALVRAAGTLGVHAVAILERIF